jgi:hypothetical protein
MDCKSFDVIVVGGGLGGMTAAYRLATLGKQVALVDSSLADAHGKLGGFAKFSGAKFSLLPAGQGLIPVCGSVRSLNQATLNVLDLLGLGERTSLISSEVEADGELTKGLFLRSYRSIVLSPTEIDQMIDRLTGLICSKVTVGSCISEDCSEEMSGGRWPTPRKNLLSRRVLFSRAGGRASPHCDSPARFRSKGRA